MKLVTYGKDNWHLLTDDQFFVSSAAWQQGRNFHLQSRGIWLPVPRVAAGEMTEHAGLKIGWAKKSSGHYGTPGWVAFRHGGGFSRNEILVRRPAGDNFLWAPINHADASALLPGDAPTDKEMDEFSEKVGFVAVDECLMDDKIRGILPWEMLVPQHLVSKPE